MKTQSYKRESYLKKKVYEWLRTLPQAYFIKIHGGPFQMIGVSDFVGVYKGRFVAIELKVGDNKPTNKQRWFLTKIQLCGGIAAVCRSVDDVKQVIERME